ncbi:aconitate hydratase AcnA [Pseudolactococcus insecticola]|uniref:Aconitate hydratase n=1 Tax=Pseudolactococcus insecticola TaxID=2709158 RepID=A0A6A0BAJ3_9LACT|nr:aconitate hydratase AcnA [Lactococcus insecticola]GFH40857.1 aconitate hydratase [Lactococcus insecticola]
MTYKKTLTANNTDYTYFDVASAVDNIEKLPYALRILTEGILRNFDGSKFSSEHLSKLQVYDGKTLDKGEIPFKPSRVILQDFTGVPAVVDLAAMRDSVKTLGGNPRLINPEVPVDLVIDHSVQVDCAGSELALQFNAKREFERNSERYEFLKWATESFDNFRVVPPATGIIHQVNIEYLSDVVTVKDGVILPDTVFGTDSHTTMINALGVLGWGVGGIEAEAAILGEASYFPMPEVIGVRFVGKLNPMATATDLALTMTKILRDENVVGKFVEYFGEGLSSLTLADRATVANMAPEYGATCGYFPIDKETLNYLTNTNRDAALVDLVESYAKANHLFYDANSQVEANYNKVIEVDLASIETYLSGPKRPQDLIALGQMSDEFAAFSKDLIPTTDAVASKNALVQNGDIAIAAITSCTNTSNPYVMMMAGLLAKNAVAKGLSVPETVKTSLAPGSKVVTAYLENAGLIEPLAALGFDVVGYGCTTCIGNSGPLDDAVSKAITDDDLLVTSVLSGNRNFEGRIHPLVKANYLASPPLVVAYAIAGNVKKNLTTEPLGADQNGKDVYLTDILPDYDTVKREVDKYVTRDLYKEYYAHVFDANEAWNDIKSSKSETYNWNDSSTYVANPPYFDGMSLAENASHAPLEKMRVLAKFADSVTTDHISPAGNIAMKSPAGEFLASQGVEPRDFNSYGSRRGNDKVMTRGTFANIRIKNQLTPGFEGGVTKYKETVMPIYDAAMAYKAENTPLLVLAGKDYGMGSSRDWAAKGTNLLGVKVVIAESFERIHRSNLAMMGLIPLQFLAGESAESLGLTGFETYSFDFPEKPEIGQNITVHADEKTFQTKLRFDSQADLEYYENGGILQMVIRKKVTNG